MHWKIFGGTVLTVLVSVFLHLYLNQEMKEEKFDRFKLAIGICISIVVALFSFFLIFGNYLEKDYVHKKKLECMWSENDDYLYVKGFDTRVKIKNFETFEKAKAADPACVVYDACCTQEGTFDFWTIDFDAIPNGALPSELYPIGDTLSETIQGCAAGFITTYV